MNDQIIHHLYGGSLPPGMTIRRHKQVPPKPQPRNVDLWQITLIKAFLETHPWSTAPQIAKSMGKRADRITGTLSIFTQNGELERRGKARQFQYRVRAGGQRTRG